ncbi:MAG: EF-hand domain-containing protein, partial [Gemmataceae bacterium]
MIVPLLLATTLAAPPSMPSTPTAFVFLAATGPVTLTLDVKRDRKPLVELWNTRITGMFQQADRNRDGLLTPTEAAHVLPRDAVRGILIGDVYSPPDDAPDLLPAMDTDRDGKVSPAEFSAYYQPLFKDLVQPHFGAIGPNQSPLLLGELFKRIDSNQDGQLTPDEFATAATKFLQADRDDDDCVSAVELFPQLVPPAPMAAMMPRDDMAMNDSPAVPTPDKPTHLALLQNGDWKALLPRLLKQ